MHAYSTCDLEYCNILNGTSYIVKFSQSKYTCRVLFSRFVNLTVSPCTTGLLLIDFKNGK